MKGCIFLSVILFCALNAFSQLAVVVDEDGYVNVRDKDKRIVDTLSSGEIVYRFGDIDGYVDVDYIKDGEYYWRYIHKSRLFDLSGFDSIPYIKTVDNNREQKVVLGNDFIEITLVQKDFIPAKNKVTKDKEGWVRKINGKEFWGTDGGLPAKEYKSVTVNIGQKDIDIPSEAYNDLYNPNLEYSEANYDIKNDILYVHSNNSDGAGGYTVVWVIEKGEYKKRYLYYGF